MIDYRYPRIFNIYALQFDTINTNTGKPKKAGCKLQWRTYKGLNHSIMEPQEENSLLLGCNYGNMHELILHVWTESGRMIGSDPRQISEVVSSGGLEEQTTVRKRHCSSSN